MILEDIKDQVIERSQAVWSQIQESSLYIKLYEKYADLNPTAQRATLIGSGALAAIFVLMIPGSYISSSNTNVESFEEKKTLLRELFRVSRASTELSAAAPEIAPADLVARMENQLRTANLGGDQIGGVHEFDNSVAQKGMRPLGSGPKNVLQKGVEVSVSKLNLRQVVEIGFQLQTLERGLKMTGLTIDANQANPHYFDVIYQLVSFSLPAEPSEPTPTKGAKGRKPPPRTAPKPEKQAPKKSSNDEQEAE